MDGSRRQRYLDKLQLLDLRGRQIQEWTAASSPASLQRDDRTRLAVYKALQECAEICSDLCAMRLRDLGRPVKDDHANIESLLETKDIEAGVAGLLHEVNGLRNRLVHTYDQLRDDLVLKFITTRVAGLLKLDAVVRAWLS